MDVRKIVIEVVDDSKSIITINDEKPVESICDVAGSEDRERVLIGLANALGYEPAEVLNLDCLELSDGEVGIIYTDDILEKWMTDFISKNPSKEDVENEIAEAEATMRNEHTWELGCCPGEFNPHTDNIERLSEYITWLNDYTNTELNNKNKTDKGNA